MSPEPHHRSPSRAPAEPLASLGGVALAFLSTAAPTAGTILMRWIAGHADLLVATAWQLLGGGLALLAAAALIEPPPAARPDGAGVGALLFLGIVGTGLAYVAWFGLLRGFHCRTSGRRSTSCQ